ncbi:glycosyltransferase [Halobellus sp. GM3]|uniref:glycosyltransferase n=1 Tax=Halobellus sp. GM3 TaxID=3458410 RepID=UPI00403E33BF
MDKQGRASSSTTDHPDHNPLDKSVLHIGNTAGVPSVIAEKQRDLGMESTVVVFNEDPYEFGADRIIQVHPEPKYIPMYLTNCIELFNKMKVIQNIISSFDVIHFHYRSVISYSKFYIPYGLDLPLWKAQGKHIVMHFHGHDIRWKGVPWFYRNFSDAILVATPDLLDWAPDTATWVPTPIDTSSFDPHYPDPNSSKPIKIVHAPTDREIKGTQHIIDAVSTLKFRGYDVELQIVEDTPHSEAIEIYKTADIVIGWMNSDYGIYGMFSKEAMALGKPVVASLSESVKTYLPEGNPVIQANPENLSDCLENLVNCRGELKKYGEKSRKYVKKTHNIDSVVHKFNNSYVV